MTCKFKNVLLFLGTVLTPSTLSETLTEINKYDPSFTPEGFATFCENVVVPNILEVLSLYFTTNDYVKFSVILWNYLLLDFKFVYKLYIVTFQFARHYIKVSTTCTQHVVSFSVFKAWIVPFFAIMCKKLNLMPKKYCILLSIYFNILVFIFFWRPWSELI